MTDRQADRGVEADHENVKRDGGERRGREGRGEESEERAHSPFYSESGIPGCCQVTVGWNLEGMLTKTTYVCRQLLFEFQCFPRKSRACS